MLQVSATRDIPVPVERVWEVMCDTAHYPDWVAGTTEVTRTDGIAAVGVTYDEVNPVIGPWKATTHWRVIECEFQRRLVHSTPDLPLSRSFTVTEVLEPVDDGTRVTITMQAETTLGPIGRLFGKAMLPQIRKDNERTLVDLERVLAVPSV